MKVFLGGTCNESEWRDILIPMLTVDYYNPVVKDWNEKSYQQELKERQECNYVLYVITPKMTGVYAIAEVIDDSNKRPERTLFCFLEFDGEKSFSQSQIMSLKRVARMIESNGGKALATLDSVADFLNGQNQ